MSCIEVNISVRTRTDWARLVLMWGTLSICLGCIVWAAMQSVRVTEPATQYTPRNIPDGNTHLQR